MAKFTIQIDSASYERIQRMIKSCDLDPRIPRAFSESDIAQLALIHLEFAMFLNIGNISSMNLLTVSVEKFEKEKKDG